MATVTPRTDTLGLENWRVDEDDYGDPLVFHRHVRGEYPAPAIGRSAERQLAQCSNCMRYLELVRTTAVTTAD